MQTSAHVRSLTRMLACFGAGLLLALPPVACSPDQVTGSAELPSSVSDPAIYETPDGALSVYRGVFSTFRTAYNCVLPVSGMLSDELETGGMGAPIGVYSGSYYTYVDSRVLAEQNDNATVCYPSVQAVRTQARQAIGLLTAYRPNDKALVGHMRAMEAYAEVLLAELYCSGIPLSTLDYGGDYTLKAGVSTQAVLEHAVTLFDSAITLSADSARILNLARIGKARALLGLGEYAAAGDVVANVPEGYSYPIVFDAQNKSFFSTTGSTWTYTVADHEGGNGLDYFSSHDPRTKVVALTGRNAFGVAYYYPDKYGRAGTAPVLLADWVEARLITAEAQLHAQDMVGWLETLNELRRTAITPALADTTDPGTERGRIDLLFRERAMWTFLTSHRQGDLRRLVREYGRDESEVFPIGSYTGGTGAYGSDVAMPLPTSEAAYNPLYKGCISRDA